MIPPLKQVFNVETYYSYLKTRNLGRPCIFLDQTTSTIDEATKEPPNTIVLAGEQSKGRGQGSNVWKSPPGCAMASIRFACRKISPLSKRLTFLQHILVLAAAKTLHQIDPIRLSKEKIRVKWPNDLYYINQTDGKGIKIGGVLVQSWELDEYHDIIMSFGLNVFNSQPTTCVKDIVGPTAVISMESIVAGIVNDFEQMTFELNDEKFQNIKMDYVSRCMQVNKVVEDSVYGAVRVKEVNDDGYLLGEKCNDGRLCVITKIIGS